MIAKIGDKVKCINVTCYSGIQIGCVYTIYSIAYTSNGAKFYVIGDKFGNNSYCYPASYFKLLQEITEKCICSIQDLMIKGCTCGHLGK